MLDGRVEDGRPEPAEPVLGPGTKVLRPAVADLVGHGTPQAQARHAGNVRTGVQVGQPEHVAKLVAEDADRGHPRAAFGTNEVRPAPAVVRQGGAMGPVQAAVRRGLNPLAGVHEHQAIEFPESLLAGAGQQPIQSLVQEDCAVPCGVGRAFLADFEVGEYLAFHLELSVRLLLVEIAEASINFLAGRIGPGVRPMAEQRLLPGLRRYLGVVLDIGIFHTKDGQPVDGFAPVIVAPVRVFALADPLGPQLDGHGNGLAGPEQRHRHRLLRLPIGEDLAQLLGVVDQDIPDLEEDFPGLEPGFFGARAWDDPLQDDPLAGLRRCNLEAQHGSPSVRLHGPARR